MLWRYIPFTENNPYDNMAMDEALLSIYSKTKQPILRLYGWSPAGISIGKYQKVEETLNLSACKEDGVAVVRRITGGGAIFHQKEITYCIVCSQDDIGMKNKTVKESFEKLTSFIMDFYIELGLTPAYAKEIYKDKKLGARCEFCFAGSEEYDIVIKNKKIGGNAQARKKGMIFQHGSIPLMDNAENAEVYFKNKINWENFTCLSKLLKNSLTIEQATQALTQAFTRVLGFELERIPVTTGEEEIKENFLLKKYTQDKWNLKTENNENS